MSDGNIGHNKTEIDILSRRGMLKNIIRFSTPIMLTGVLQLFFNDCDIIVCRYFGSGNGRRSNFFYGCIDQLNRNAVYGYVSWCEYSHGKMRWLK